MSLMTLLNELLPVGIESRFRLPDLTAAKSICVECKEKLDMREIMEIDVCLPRLDYNYIHEEI